MIGCENRAEDSSKQTVSREIILDKPKSDKILNLSLQPLERSEPEVKNIRKRIDGRWEVRKMVNGKRYSKIVKTYKEALQVYQQLVKTLKKMQVLQLAPSNKIKLYDYAKHWAETYKKNFVKANSYTGIISGVEKIKGSMIDIPVNLIDTLLLQRYINSLDHTRQNELNIVYLNAIFKRLVKDKLIKDNPMDDTVKRKKIKAVRKPFVYNEQVTIMEAIKGTDIENYILIYLFTGIRRNELDIHTIKSSIESNLLKVRSEKKREDEVYRYIDLTDRTIELIKNTDFKYSVERVARLFRKILNDLNMPKGYNLHTLRHTFTLNQFYLGTPEKFIQEWLGHEELQVTRNHYMAIDRTLTKEKILELYPNYYYVIK